MKTIHKPLTLMTGIVTALIILLLSQKATAQPDATDELMYKAYLSNENQQDSWKKAIQARTEDYAKAPNDKQAGLRLALSQFGLLSSTMRTQDEKLFDEYYANHVALLEKLIETDKKWAEPRALLSAVYGLKMGYSPMQGMFLGPKSGSQIEKAKDLDPKSSLAWKVYANSKFFTPEMWGGDLKEAIEAYEKCVSLYDSKPADLKSNWMYLDALAFQGQAYMKNGDTGKAIATYEKALQAEPEFGWVKYALLPKAKTKAQGK